MPGFFPRQETQLVFQGSAIRLPGVRQYPLRVRAPVPKSVHQSHILLNADFIRIIFHLHGVPHSTTTQIRHKIVPHFTANYWSFAY